MSSQQDFLYELVKKIPEGKVTTYGQLAKAVGLATPRIVGWWLHRNPDPQHIPCHRVVFSDGRVTDGFAFGGAEAQRKLLEEEGISFSSGKVDLKKHLQTF